MVKYIDLKVMHAGQAIPLRHHSCAKTEVRQLFAGEIYPRVPFLQDAETIIDVGGSVGAAALYFSLWHPKATIFSFEPHRESYDVAVLNTKNFDRIRMHNFGLDETDRKAPLFLGVDTHMTNSVHRGVPYNSNATEMCSFRRASTTLQKIGLDSIDILKVDTEGCEVPILRDILTAYTPTCIHLEYHSDGDRRQIDQMLLDYLMTASTSHKAHLGMATYVRSDSFPSKRDRDLWAIGPNASGGR